MSDKGMRSALVVDGDREFGRALSKVLGRAGYRVTLAASLVEAGELLGKKQYRLILLDLPLQQQSGLELVRYLHEEAPDSKVIVITVDNNSSTYREALDAGAFAFLSKPFKMSKLLGYARMALKRHAAVFADHAIQT